MKEWFGGLNKLVLGAQAALFYVAALEPSVVTALFPEEYREQVRTALIFIGFIVNTFHKKPEPVK